MDDAECPYCETRVKVDHDDGYGYEEERIHNQECDNCGMTFAYNTLVSFSYSTAKAPCLNGEPCQFKPTITFPKRYTKMRCKDCDAVRPCTDEEMAAVLAEHDRKMAAK